MNKKNSGNSKNLIVNYGQYRSNIIFGRRIGYYFASLPPQNEELTLAEKETRLPDRKARYRGLSSGTSETSETLSIFRNKGSSAANISAAAGKMNRRRVQLVEWPNSNSFDYYSRKNKKSNCRSQTSRSSYRRDLFNRSSWCQFVNLILCLFAYCFALCFSTAEAAGNNGRPASATRGASELCRQWITSDLSKNGNFTSPNYPEPYPADVHCSYQFLGQEDERVQILFTDFDLYSPSREITTKERCISVDVVNVFITIKGQKERVDNFCGSKLPPQLMSNGPNMTVEFHSEAQDVRNVRGFRAIYRFLTNFGITSGEQAQEGCTFYFNSSVRSNGTFMSPNYPGFYPRDTQCSYFFLGRSASERVFITFAYFDVDGIPLCGSETASDYVEFSNFRTIDRKLPRHCGGKKPEKIDSDGDFFRVTFKSNDKFDGTGFEAFYQFRSNIDPSNQVKKHGGPSSASDVSCSPYRLLLTLCLLGFFRHLHDNAPFPLPISL